MYPPVDLLEVKNLAEIFPVNITGDTVVICAVPGLSILQTETQTRLGAQHPPSSLARCSEVVLT
jgi:hypothetical protein